MKFGNTHKMTALENKDVVKNRESFGRRGTGSPKLYREIRSGPFV